MSFNCARNSAQCPILPRFIHTPAQLCSVAAIFTVFTWFNGGSFSYLVYEGRRKITADTGNRKIDGKTHREKKTRSVILNITDYIIYYQTTDDFFFLFCGKRE